jgi:prepilin-type N-terminal cleavage/methylation domain-containing protein
MSFSRRHGFTILELLVALVLSAGVLLAGRALTEQAAGVSETIAVDAAIADSARARARILRTVVRNIDIGSGTSNFSGDTRTAKFASWCSDGQVLKQHCAVTLTVDSLVTLTDSSASRVLVRNTVPGVLRYLGDASDGGHWYRAWGPGVTLPLAVGIVFRTDTTVLRIGDRG